MSPPNVNPWSGNCDLRVNADGSISFVPGTRAITNSIDAWARVELARLTRERIDKMWSEAVASWIDRWTPFTVKAATLLNDDALRSMLVAAGGAMSNRPQVFGYYFPDMPRA